MGQQSGLLRILHLAALVGSRSGGLGPTASGLAEHQRALGHGADIWSLDTDVEITLARQTGHLAKLDVRNFGTRGPWQFGYSPTLEHAIGSMLGAGYDILHQHSIWMGNSRATTHWRNKFRRPTIVAPHGTLEAFTLKQSNWKKQLAYRAYEGANLAQASCLHATAENEIASFRRFGLRNPIAIIPNGIASDWLISVGEGESFRADFRIPREPRILLFLSRVHPKKGLPLLFEAIRQLDREMDGWLLVIAGPEEVRHRQELETLAARLGISDRLRFVGMLTGADKRNAFDAADLLVLPSHSENFGVVVAEALGAGVPVITTRGTPWQDVETYQCGWWVDVSAEKLGHALRDALCRPRQELKVMGVRGKRLVAGKYTWQKAAERSIQLYEWLLDVGPRPDFVVWD